MYIPLYLIWLLPVTIFILGIIWALRTKAQGDYDFGTPFIILGKFLISVILALISVIIILILTL